MKTSVITSLTYQNHNTGPGHPERVDRVKVVNEELKKFGKKIKWDLRFGTKEEVGGHQKAEIYEGATGKCLGS